MECRITSIKRKAALTLVEICVGLVIGSLVLLVIANLSFHSARTFAAMANYLELDDMSRLALDRMTREIRQVNFLTLYATNQVTFQDSDGQTLQYSYSPTGKTLTRIKGGVSEVLLTGCNSLSFSIFQRNTTNGTFDQYPASTNAFTNTCKLVQVEWTCSRGFLGNRTQTENVQSSKIVIRNQ